MSAKMFLKPIPGYREKTIVVDGAPHKIAVPITISKAKAFDVECSAPGYPSVSFVMDRDNGVSRHKAMQVASDRYRYVMVGVPNPEYLEGGTIAINQSAIDAAKRERATLAVHCTVTPITAQIGASA